MRIILANPRGFCAGVYMAVDVVDQLLDLCPGEPIFVFHEIVHNWHVVQRFRDRGVQFVEHVDEVPEGSILVFSAHGVSPAVRAQAQARRLRAIDASCPLVLKVHAEAIRYARKGYQILLIGHKNHQEVIGTAGEVPQAIQVVESPSDIASLSIRDPNRLVYLTQTTLSLDDAEVCIAALRRAFPAMEAPPASDICYATTNRQKTVRILAPECDLVIVVGSRNSSNSVRLIEIAQSAGTPARLVDDAEALEDRWFTGVGRVLLTAGASAPEDLVLGILRKLLDNYGGTIEQHEVYREDIEFGLPASLKNIMREQGIDPGSRRIHRVDAGDQVAAWAREQGVGYATVDLTVGHTA
ncbi:MAG: 4-hydroxy-3-methylbut-2-enyl diphosphate reductase [Planctomycetota bacterium]|nr:4-hydroxy-3-methylbut-2-enyl diphosphate reductase [Planctomycetota bacterium]MDA1105529.1 4-hydroxy-3-methylbut-2-enyl diphosphate reductase [Planctomycetota bacterium]